MIPARVARWRLCFDRAGGEERATVWRQASEGKHFFFEKKKQKTFMSWLFANVTL